MEIEETKDKELFENLTFAICGTLGRPRPQITDMILENGGEVLAAVNKKVNYVISEEDELKTDGPRIKAAKSLSIPIVTLKFLDDCIDARKVPADPVSYLVTIKEEPLEEPEASDKEKKN